MNRLAIAIVFLAACVSPGPGAQSLPDATRSFKPASIELLRYPAMCGVQDPPFDDADLYTLRLVGSSTATTRPTEIDVSFHRTLSAGQDLPIALQMFGIVSSAVDPQGNTIDVFYGQLGNLPGVDNNTFEWKQGTDASEVDDQPLTAASFQIHHMPSNEGDTGSFTIRIVFADGGVYDATITAPLLAQAFHGCPVG
jgi:hypothetical protein